jgi:hypothetical protein
MFIVYTKHKCNQKREGPRILQPHTLSPTDPGSHTLEVWFTSTDTYPLLLRTVYLPYLWSGSIRTTTDSATQHLTQHTALVMPYTQMPLRKCSDLIDRLYTWSESTSIALELSFLQTEGLIVPPIPSLYPRYSCSNELNHISDAAEDHEHGKNSLL